MIEYGLTISVSFIALLISELVYFRIADRYNIIDKPNERSSHTLITIRGGGIVFVLAGLGYFIYAGFTNPWYWFGFLLIAVVSFVDDIVTLSSRVRMPLQFLAVVFMVIDVMPSFDFLTFIIALILITGVINAYNFMDGINGITAGYSLVVLVSLFALNSIVHFADPELIVVFIIADLVFAFFNFRKRAKCFAGDVGSVSMAFVVTYLTFQLIMSTGNLIYILLLAVYGVDSVLTILYRLRKKENIFEAHRSHVYQWLVKPGPYTHLQVSTLYMIVQGAISIGIIYFSTKSTLIQILYSTTVLLMLSVLYIGIKHHYKKRFGLV